ncbi:MAG: MraY family glycosyltransferase [Planctomycetota bacterium]|nr:MraY family glycosyltransferase [Planctomycetota bacterium]
MKTFIVIFFGSALIAILGTPIVTRIARAWGLVDKPGVRKVHTTPVPRIGGVAVMLATLAILLPVFALDNPIGEALRKVQTQVVTLLACGMAVFLMGLWDDVRGLRAILKLVCLGAASLAICISGARIQTIDMTPWFTLNLGVASWPITMLWIIGVTVGMNFIDGLDGLAAGISAIVCGTIAAFAFYNGKIAMAILMLALMGSLVGFLFFNFNPAKVFLGDCGSMFLGFLIGAGSVVCQAKTSTLVGIALPACALGVPILDAAFTMIRRGVLDRRSLFAAERGHIHHRLLDMGLRQRHVVLIIYGITLLGAGLGLLMMSAEHTEVIGMFIGVLLFLLLVFHCAGAARLGETVAAVRHKLEVSREIKREKYCFEDAQLRVREAKTFEDWWKAVCNMSEEMDFTWVALTVADKEGMYQTSVWRCPGPATSPRDLVTVTIPVVRKRPGCTLQLEAGVRVNGSVEAAGRRAGLLGRLVDESDSGSTMEMLGALARLPHTQAADNMALPRGSSVQPPLVPTPDSRPPLTLHQFLPTPEHPQEGAGSDETPSRQEPLSQA